MHKCTKCGREYDGEFCPECGERNTAACPRCGKVLEEGARFCAACGYSLVGNLAGDEPGKADVKVMADKIATNKILATVFKYTPAGLFGLLALLMFAFYAAPVDTDPLGLGLSSGNVYRRAFAMFSGDPEIMQEVLGIGGEQGFNVFAYIVSMLLIMVPIIGVISLISLISMIFTGNKRIKQMETVTLVHPIIYIGLAVYLMIDVKKSGMAVGPAPILMTVFAALFLVLEITVLLVRKSFYRKNPEYDVLT